ncbi:hypothetical protein ABZZ79_32165 [Streptomyces sp. NPDC006458]|uniref:hypothetical protein n=1 Tax=Streptomyces sp. NPDC006458 TaxID=3154302 RepID=UPI0033AAF114
MEAVVVVVVTSAVAPGAVAAAPGDVTRVTKAPAFAVLGANSRFGLVMAAGFAAGAVLGVLLLGVFSDLVLLSPCWQ